LVEDLSVRLRQQNFDITLMVFKYVVQRRVFVGKSTGACECQNPDVFGFCGFQFLDAAIPTLTLAIGRMWPKALQPTASDNLSGAEVGA
jgi:hypothetical protein